MHTWLGLKRQAHMCRFDQCKIVYNLEQDLGLQYLEYIRVCIGVC
jgi:hypothetical protein